MSRSGRFAYVKRENRQRHELLSPKSAEHEGDKFGELFSDIKSLTNNMESLITQMKEQKTKIESVEKMMMKGRSDVQ